ncbi:hypothetical protein D9M68_591440 [compost metagenome]
MQLLLLHQRRGAGGHQQAQVHLTAHDVVGDLRAPAIGHVHQLDLGLVLHHLHRQMQHGAHARRGVGQRVGLRPRQRDELAHVPRGQAGAGQQHDGRGGHQGDRLQIRFGVVLHGGIDQAGHADGAVEAHHQRVAIGPGMRGLRHAQHSARARHVIHDDGLLEPVRQFLRHQPGGGIDVAAGAERHDQGQGPGFGPGGFGGHGRSGAQRSRQRGDGQEQTFEHGGNGRMRARSGREEGRRRHPTQILVITEMLYFYRFIR